MTNELPKYIAPGIKHLSEKQVKEVEKDVYKGTEGFYKRTKKMGDGSGGCGPRFESAGVLSLA